MSDRDRLDVLRATTELGGWTDAQLRRLLPFVDEASVPAGQVIAEGPPEEIAKKAGSYTAEHLKPVLDSETRRRNSALKAVSTAASSTGRKVSGDLGR